jgi:DNA processing protein
MTTPHACPDCLRRSWLLSALGPYVEKATLTSGVGGLGELLALTNVQLADTVAPGAGGRLVAEVEGHDEEWFSGKLDEAGCWAICRHEAGYPIGLRDLTAAPAALIGRGDAAVVTGLGPHEAVTIVGSRRASSYGREVARELGREVSTAGLVVISGLAFGIDACAHRGALDTGGRTLAVLGCGPDTSYPAAHRSLWRQVAETGAVISELPPGSTPWRWSFPARNRVMAALAGMTVVVEAAARSGSLITADLAAELGRDLGAVPGPVTSRASAGPNELLAGGACVVRGGQDVLDAMLGAGAPSSPGQHGSSGTDERSPSYRRQVDAYTVVGYHGPGRAPYVTTVHTDDGPETALDLGHKAFEVEHVDLELQIVSLFHGEPKLVDFDEPLSEDH